MRRFSDLCRRGSENEKTVLGKSVARQQTFHKGIFAARRQAHCKWLCPRLCHLLKKASKSFYPLHRAGRFCGLLSVSKNWFTDSKFHKCGVTRRIGKPLDRVSHDAAAHRAAASPFLIFMKAKDFAPCEARRGLRPSTRPPFEKGGRKLFCETTFSTRCAVGQGTVRRLLYAVEGA